ncbi:hypothetical protein [Dictyobacter arantiisoli]|uniref:Uncharacterized protein n=1 Tax=Dictyobacter arantiisoli TaxID=2014874 RepID=A0A5A5TJ65_9CHLR|nr:hypothetical protein [Dictyobacter arantiisoli]GCF11265.1 hypothetical protein KDI_48290 [Dictyobacter arantiisoli]
MKRTAAAKKQVVIIARIQWKHEDKVCYLVRASKPLVDGSYILCPRGIVEIDGTTYQSVVRDGERYQVYQVCFLNGQDCRMPVQSEWHVLPQKAAHRH